MSNLVIVALPTKDDYVQKISSEQVPHMTLLFLGEDASKVDNLGKILDFTKHAADTSLKRFGLEVDRRGELGPEQADVLFFSKTKWSGFESVNLYRSYLLKDDNIRKAYESAVQFPIWEPHLTLGYPATPAKSDNRDYPGITYVSFDRIAVWFGDYEGIEFPLGTYDWDMDVAMGTSEVIEEILSHHGVLGMKWGHRSSGGGVSRSDRKTAKKETKVIKKLSKSANSRQIKIQLHNSTYEGMTKNITRINNKPEYKKAIKAGTLHNPNSPVTKKYFKEFADSYIKELNRNANLPGNPLPVGKKYQVSGSNKDFLGFKVDIVDAKHDDSSSFRVIFVKDADGQIIGLKLDDDSMSQAEDFINDILSHHGVLGMKWGRRSSRTTGPQKVSVTDKRKSLKTSGGEGHTAHPDAVRVRKIGQVGKKSGLKALSDKELQDYSKRINLEQNVKRLQYTQKNPAQKFVAQILGQTGKNTVQNTANDVASQQVKKHLAKVAILAA